MVGLTDRMNMYPARLSGGQKQRVAIARALATSPKYLLCDEATSALDPNTTQSILNLLKDINEKLGVTIIVITHEMRVIDKICDRVAVIDRSRIAEEGTVREVFAAPKSQIARELILPGSKAPVNKMVGGKRLRVTFDGESSEEPIIANMILECQARVNILFADTKELDGALYGQMVLELPEDSRQAGRILAWLEEHHNTYREED